MRVLVSVDARDQPGHDAEDAAQQWLAYRPVFDMMFVIIKAEENADG